VSEGHTLLLGFIAGITILLGMPLGRVRAPMPMLRLFLNAVAVGVLVFLIWDVLSAAWEPIDAHLGALHDGHGSLPGLIGYALLFVGGLGIGLLGLAYYERWMSRRTGGAGLDARRLALLIAVGIGLHNFAEGLGIGGAAATGEIGLATVLVVGFALHNATEGFGITAPLAGSGERASWARLIMLGLIGGAPTFVGTAIGRSVQNEAVTVAFLTLAAGSIVYVVAQLLGIAARAGRRDVLSWGLLLGVLAGFATDGVVTFAGI
jgi:ZIP family zinc transporter